MIEVKKENDKLADQVHPHTTELDRRNIAYNNEKGYIYDVGWTIYINIYMRVCVCVCVCHFIFSHIGVVILLLLT